MLRILYSMMKSWVNEGIIPEYSQSRLKRHPRVECQKLWI